MVVRIKAQTTIRAGAGGIILFPYVGPAKPEKELPSRLGYWYQR